ncbi:MAG: GlxA family transcriptional regulator [Actinomycetota bacterium]
MASAPPNPQQERHVVLVVHPGHQVLDLAGPHEVFAAANELLRHRDGPTPYRLTVASRSGGTVASESGLAVADTVPTAELDPAAIDTLIAAGGNGVHDACSDEALVGWIRAVAPSCRRVGSVCSGTFLLAGAGLLSGRRVTTHWARAGRLASQYPDVRVDPEPIHIRDGDVWTSAGVTAGIDLALALVEDDHGADLAQNVAQWLVMFLRRPGGQAQFAAPVWSGAAHHDGIRDALDVIHADPGADISVPDLAATAAMSTRNFTRVFTREVGTPPGRYLEQVRVAAARRLLETSPDTTDVIAERCGFGTAETLRRAFQRCVGTSPGAYRRRFTHDRATAP